VTKDDRIEESTARLIDTRQPADVVRAAGEWLAMSLADHGFQWLRSRGVLQRRQAARREQLYLQNSSWNRSGRNVSLTLTVNVRQGRLRQWRRANPDRTRRADDWLSGHGLGTLLNHHNHRLVDLTEPDLRATRLAALLDDIRQTALPWFASTATLDRIVADVPDVTVDQDADSLIEWLVSQDERARAEAMLVRWLSLPGARHTAFDTGWRLADSGQRPGAELRWATVGWTSFLLGLPRPTIG
jgi:hypothetical protein